MSESGGDDDMKIKFTVDWSAVDEGLDERARQELRIKVVADPSGDPGGYSAGSPLVSGGLSPLGASGGFAQLRERATQDRSLDLNQDLSNRQDANTRARQTSDDRANIDYQARNASIISRTLPPEVDPLSARVQSYQQRLNSTVNDPAARAAVLAELSSQFSVMGAPATGGATEQIDPEERLALISRGLKRRQSLRAAQGQLDVRNAYDTETEELEQPFYGDLGPRGARREPRRLVRSDASRAGYEAEVERFQPRTGVEDKVDSLLSSVSQNANDQQDARDARKQDHQRQIDLGFQARARNQLLRQAQSDDKEETRVSSAKGSRSREAAVSRFEPQDAALEGQVDQLFDSVSNQPDAPTPWYNDLGSLFRGTGGAGRGGGGGGVGGSYPNARFGPLRMGRLGQLFTYGYAINEVLRATNAYEQYGGDLFVAGNDQRAQIQAESKLQDTITSFPILGPLTSVMLNAPMQRAEVDKIVKESNLQNVAGDSIKAGREMLLRSNEDRAAYGSPAGYQREVTKLKNDLERDTRSITSRYREETTAVSASYDERIHRLQDDYDSYSADDVGWESSGSKQRRLKLESAHKEKDDAISKIDADRDKELANAKSDNEQQLKELAIEQHRAVRGQDISAMTSLLQTVGLSDLASNYNLRSTNEANEAAIQDPELRKATAAANRAAETAQATELGRQQLIRNVQYSTNTAANFALGSNDRYGAQSTQIAGGAEIGVIDAQLQDKPKAFAEGVSKLFAFLGEASLDLSRQTVAIDSGNRVAGLLRSGYEYKAAVEGINQRRDAALSLVPQTSIPVLSTFVDMLRQSIVDRAGSETEDAKVKEDREKDISEGSVVSSALRQSWRPLTATINDIQTRFKAATEGLDHNSPAYLRLSNERAAATNEAYQTFDDNTLGIDIGQTARGRAINRLLARDPIGAQAANTVGQTEEEVLNLARSGRPGEAGVALDLGIKSLQLQQRQYMEAFRGVSLDLRTMNVTNPRDVEHPAAVGKEFTDDIKQLQGMQDAIKNGAAEGIREGLRDAIAK